MTNMKNIEHSSNITTFVFLFYFHKFIPSKKGSSGSLVK
jgi:hypothetical protein